MFSQHLQNIKKINYETEHPGEYKEGYAEEETKKEEEVRVNKRTHTCDEIFSEYLGFIAKRINKKYYIKLIMFVLFFRECTNRNSAKLKEDSRKMPKDLFPPMETQVILSNSVEEDYCATHNAEQLPDVSNDFIVNYMKDKKKHIPNPEAMDLTQNFCHWLYINGYTCAKLSQIHET